MAIYVANVSNPAGFVQADNGGNYQNPSWSFQPTSAGVYGLTIPTYTVRRNDVPGEAVYDYPQATLAFVRQWTQGATYQDLDVVRWSPASPNDPRFYSCLNPTGAGTNPPTYQGNNANWAHVGPTAEFVVFGSLSDDPQVGPYTGFALLTGGSQTLSYPFLVAYDVPLSDEPNLDRERKIAAFDRMTVKVPQFWRSRNHDAFAPVVWAAACAARDRLGRERGG
ncbi:MAG: hypothetical protein KIS66_05245 [Fimbriimonadaceae bacterium]|nr:hypothetical protein [Fimbriimonadaceae bacterium]